MTRIVEIPVSEEAARALAEDPARARQVGLLVERMLTYSGETLAHRLSGIFALTSMTALLNGITDEDVDAEFAHYKAQRRRR